MKTGISGPVSADLQTVAPRQYGGRAENRSPQPITLLSEEQSPVLASWLCGRNKTSNHFNIQPGSYIIWRCYRRNGKAEGKSCISFWQIQSFVRHLKASAFHLKDSKEDARMFVQGHGSMSFHFSKRTALLTDCSHSTLPALKKKWNK